MDIVKLAIRNARLTISVLVFLLLAGCGRLSVDAEGSGARRSDPDHVCQPDLSGHLAGGFGAPAAAADGDQAEEPEGSQGDALGRLPGRRLCAGRVPAAVDLATALQDTRSKVQDGKADLPQAAEEPTVTEVNISEFPVLVVTLSGDVPERVLTAAARELRDRIEEVPGVLEGSLQGARDDLVEVVIDPMKLVLLRAAARPADPGRRRLQQPGRRRQHRRLGGQIRRQGAVADRDAGGCRQPAGGRRRPTAVVQARDIATVRSTFKDAETITRLDGKPAIAIEVKKRIGANLIDTLEQGAGRSPTPSSRRCPKACTSPTRRTSRSSSTSCSTTCRTTC